MSTTPRAVTKIEDFDTFTEEECRDWLAEKLCGVTIKVREPQFVAERNHPYDPEKGSFMFYHPIPATLDEAAKLPWRLDSVETFCDGNESGWSAMASFISKENPIMGDQSVECSGDTERLARFILRCKIEFLSNK